MGREGLAVLTWSPDPISNLSAGKLGVGSAEAGESPEPTIDELRVRGRACL